MSCKVMGIVNVTPDSFSDGGQFYKPEEAIRRVKNLIADGSEIIDLGGESTRPGSVPLTWEEEWSRLEPVLRGLSPEMMGSVPLSVDTYHPETAERSVDLGVQIINCVYADPAVAMARICAKSGAELIIPHRLSGSVPTISGSVPNVLDGVLGQIGIEKVYLDPMIGFGTSREEDIELLGSVPELAKLGKVLVGASRKRIVKKLTGEKMTGKNLGGNLGIAVWSAMKGASVVRVHDVKETFQALKVVETLGSLLSQNVHGLQSSDFQSDN